MRLKPNSQSLMFVSKEMEVYVKIIDEEVHLSVSPSPVNRLILKEKAKIEALKKCILSLTEWISQQDF